MVESIVASTIDYLQVLKQYHREKKDRLLEKIETMMYKLIINRKS